jgi:hypothetical protein
MHSDPKQRSVKKQQIEWRGYGLLSLSRTLSPTALSLPVLSATGTMPCDPWPTYEETIYKRLEESIFEYMDEDMIDKLVPAIKRALTTELTRRNAEVNQVKTVMNALFPSDEA